MAKIRQLALAGAAVGLLASCGPQGGLDLNNFDPDFRGWGGGGLDTANAAAQAMPRPASDQRGVISYPGYQVAIARQGDSVATIAARLGLSPRTVHAHLRSVYGKLEVGTRIAAAGQADRLGLLA